MRPSVLRRDGHSTRSRGERAATGLVAGTFAIVAVTRARGRKHRGAGSRHRAACAPRFVVGATGPIAREAHVLGIRASVGCPITVDGRLWGVIAASKTRDEPFPLETGSRQAWQLIDELNRARAGAPASGYLAPPRLITRADVPNGDVFESPGGYRANYSRIWGR